MKGVIAEKQPCSIIELICICEAKGATGWVVGGDDEWSRVEIWGKIRYSGTYNGGGEGFLEFLLMGRV